MPSTMDSSTAVHSDVTEATRVGTVLKKSQGSYQVRAEGQLIPCTTSNRLRKVLIYPTAAPTSLHPRVQKVRDIQAVDPVAVGDQVHFVDAGDGTGLILEVLPRRNQLSRLDSGPKPLEQVLVANADQVVIVTAAHPSPSWDLVDRYLALAETSYIPAVICITKLDLVEDAEALRAEIENYRAIGYAAVLTSALRGIGVEAAREMLMGKLSVLIGKSGAGKTTLLNAIQPGLGLRVNAVNRHTGEGRHTTAHLEMFDLDLGGQVVDTPGLRTFKLWDVTLFDLADLFPEMRPHLGLCRFAADCTHLHEPGCAVRAAVADGRISQRRYASYGDMKDYFGL